MKILIFNASDKLTNLTKGKLSKIVSETGEWAVGLKDKDLSYLGMLISTNDLDSEINPSFEQEEGEIEEYGEFEFKYHKSSKMIFLTYLSNIWETESNFVYAKKALEDIEKFEIKLDKDLFFFTESEVVKVINEIADKHYFYGLKFKIKVYKDYFNFYAKDYGLKAKDNFWSVYQTTKNLSKIIGVKEGERVLTKDDLVNLFNTVVNPQQGIVPLLIFEGLSLSRKYPVDDIRSLKKENVGSNSVFLEAVTDEKDKRGFNLSVDRVVELDKDVMVCIAKTVASENIVRINRHELEVMKLKDTPYVLRSVEGRKSSSTGDILSYGGAYDRLLECERQFESLNVEIDDFSAGYIASCGKSYYIKKYMDDGLTETEAIIKTLKRFGEWNTIGDHKQEVKLDTNKIRIARLRRSYPMYLEK